MLKTASEFAAFCGVSDKTLKAYNSAGLIAPAAEEGGEARYTIFQFYDFSFIHYLCTLGLTLSEVAAYLPTRSEKNMRALLSALKTRELTPTSRERLEGQLEKLDEAAAAASLPEVFLAQREEQWFIKSAGVDPLAPAPAQVSAAFLAQCGKDGLDIYGFSGTLMQREFMDGVRPAISAFFTQSREGLTGAVKKDAGEYLCAYLRGPMEAAPSAQNAIRAYAKENAIALKDYCYASYVLGGMSNTDISQYLILLEWPLA